MESKNIMLNYEDTGSDMKNKGFYAPLSVLALLAEDIKRDPTERGLEKQGCLVIKTHSQASAPLYLYSAFARALNAKPVMDRPLSAFMIIPGLRELRKKNPCGKNRGKRPGKKIIAFKKGIPCTG